MGNDDVALLRGNRQIHIVGVLIVKRASIIACQFTPLKHQEKYQIQGVFLSREIIL